MPRRIRFIQQAIIDKLKSDPVITTALTDSDEIREDEWPSSDWTYPCLRVAVNLLNPTSTGNCHLSNWLTTFSIFVFTEYKLSGEIYDASSRECSDIMRRVTTMLHGKRLTFSNGYSHETRVNIRGQNAPVPLPSPGGWRGEVLGEFRFKET